MHRTTTTCIGNQREIQITILSLSAILLLKAATCTAFSADLSVTSSLAHVFYTSKSAVKLFQLVPAALFWSYQSADERTCQAYHSPSKTHSSCIIDIHWTVEGGGLIVFAEPCAELGRLSIVGLSVLNIFNRTHFKWPRCLNQQLVMCMCKDTLHFCRYPLCIADKVL